MQHYYHEVHGAVFVVDAADPKRFEEAKAALHEALKDKRLENKPIIIFANKQDLPGAMGAPDLAIALELSLFKTARYHIVPCVAKRGAENLSADPRLKQGMRWLIDSIKGDYNGLTARVTEDVRVKKEVLFSIIEFSE